MAFLDFLQNVGRTAAKGAGSALKSLDIQPQQLIKPALTVALGIPAAYAVQSLTPRRSRPRAAANVYRLFGNMALEQLQRPEREKRELTNLLAQQGMLRLKPTFEGQEPVRTIGTQSLYPETRTLAEAMPKVFDRFTPKPRKTIVGVPPLPGGQAGPPVPQTVMPPTTPLQTAIQAYGSQMNRPDALGTLLNVLGSQEAATQKAAQQAAAQKAVMDLITAGGGSLRPTFQAGPSGLTIGAAPGRELTPQQQYFQTASPEQQALMAGAAPKPRTKSTMDEFRESIWPHLTNEQKLRMVGAQGGTADQWFERMMLQGELSTQRTMLNNELNSLRRQQADIADALGAGNLQLLKTYPDPMAIPDEVIKQIPMDVDRVNYSLSPAQLRADLQAYKDTQKAMKQAEGQLSDLYKRPPGGAKEPPPAKKSPPAKETITRQQIRETAAQYKIPEQQVERDFLDRGYTITGQ